MSRAQLRVAVIHYHLAPGGVTRVIEAQVRALAAAGGSATVLHGGEDSGFALDAAPGTAGELEIETVRIEGLGYDRGAPPDPAALGERLAAALARHRVEPDTAVVHVHNHALGKNTALPGALAFLAARGFALLLQIHDFAEDFRPREHARLARALAHESADTPLYPLAPRIHYAVINPRDAATLDLAGVPADRIHQLANPVAARHAPGDARSARARLEARHPRARGRDVLLYPVRGIRRKNLGEALLWSSVAPDAFVAVTLAPLNPVERPAWTHWCSLARRLDLPFAAGLGADLEVPLEDLFALAGRALTTSVAEGFGLAFVEPWLHGLDLAGRDLPETTGWLRDAGLDLDALATTLRVPLDWVGARGFRTRFCALYAETAATYGRSVDARALEQTLDWLMEDGTIDFARLPTDDQSRVLERLGAADRARLRALNAALFEPPDAELSRTRVAHNRDAVAQQLGAEAAGARLLAAYAALREAPGGPIEGGASRAAILDAFLSPARFHPVRVDR